MAMPVERDHLSFVVRADRLRWLDDGARADNEVDAVVLAIEYTGSLSTISLSLPTGGLVKMEQHESLLRRRAPATERRCVSAGTPATPSCSRTIRPRSWPERIRPRSSSSYEEVQDVG